MSYETWRDAQTTVEACDEMEARRDEHINSSNNGNDTKNRSTKMFRYDLEQRRSRMSFVIPAQRITPHRMVFTAIEKQ